MFIVSFKNHVNQIHPNPVCEYCGKKFDSVSTLDSHKLTECDKITVFCALKNFGCSDSMIRNQMSNHYMTEQHQNAIITFVRRLTPYLSKSHYMGNPDMEIDMPLHTTTTDNLNADIQNVYETIDVLAGGIQALNGDVQRLSTESVGFQVTVEDINRELAALKLSAQEENAFLDGFKPNQEILSQDLASLKQQVDDMQFVSYDGTLIWKISSFKEKMSKFCLLFTYILLTKKKNKHAPSLQDKLAINI